MSGLVAKTKLTFRVEPEEQGGATQAVSIDRRRMTAPVKKKRGEPRKKPDRRLVIGFDTEYQSADAVDVTEVRRGEVEAKNLVLSYQYSTKLVTRSGGSDDKQVSGIIIPDEGKRLSLPDFIAFAVGAWLDRFPGEKAPYSIYLVGHFNRADLPAFDEFQTLSRSHLSAIRNTFISMGSAIKFPLGKKTSDLTFHVELRDTYLLAPGNAKALSELGAIVGFEKIRLHDDVAEEIRIKSNMAELRSSDWPLFRDYAIRDAEICVSYAERVLRQHDALFNAFELPVTLTSFGTVLSIMDWEKSKEDRLSILGKERFDRPRYNKSLGYAVKEVSEVYIERVQWAIDFVTETYHGGRNEQFWYGPAPEGKWRDLDLSSAYTTAMSLLRKARWRESRQLDSVDGIGPFDLAFCCVDFEFPESVRFPTLPVRTANGIIFPRKGRSYCAAPEVWLAKQLGAELKLDYGVSVPVEDGAPVFRSFIMDCIKRRNEHPKGTFDNLFWKEVGNSTYGKTAQGLRKKRVYDVRDDDMVELPESRITQPFFASFITSYTRAVLGEILNAFPDDVHVFSVTTDGFLATPTDEQIEAAMSGVLARSFTKARSDLVGDDNALEVKHAIGQPIGWRTRGSATLKPGDDEATGIVLQKGGIKVDELLRGKAENDHIIRMFLNRNASQVVIYTTGMGIKDMLRSNADFVSRENQKQLRMEFDWKRKPVNPRDVAFQFDGKEHSHLAFGTAPLDTVDEFGDVREAWSTYNKKSRFCLKTLADYEQFDRYLKTKELPPDVTKYASRVDGDLKRLKRDLCRAFVARQAGFDQVLAAKKVKYKEFVAALNACEIPCKVFDLDNASNARTKPFEPGTAMDTERVREALAKLKAEHFPELEVDVFFERDEAVSGDA